MVIAKIFTSVWEDLFKDSLSMDTLSYFEHGLLVIFHFLAVMRIGLWVPGGHVYKTAACLNGFA